jgi:hypothetical protein
VDVGGVVVSGVGGALLGWGLGPPGESATCSGYYRVFSFELDGHRTTSVSKN